MGPQGSGKGTQAELLEKKYDGMHLSTGDMVRDSVDPQVHETLEKGELLDDKSITKVLKEALDKQPAGKPIVLDGYPRTLNQAEQLEKILADRGDQVELAIYLVVPRAESIKRLRKRAEVEGRTDDTPEAIEQRLQQFEDETLPVVDYYRQQGVLQEVDGQGSVPEIFTRIEKVIPWQ